MVSRARFGAAAIKAMAKPTWYVYGGRSIPQGCDCWGFWPALFTELGEHDIAKLMTPWWTDKAYEKLPTVKPDQLKMGDAIFYGGDEDSPWDVDHAMMYLGNGVIIGQSGGGQTTTSILKAQLANPQARVRVYPEYTYRADIKGFRSLGAFLSD